MDALAALERWYASRCDGDWEHTYGIRIETLDNPGWSLQVDLMDTPLERTEFSPVALERSEHDWVICKVDQGRFVGHCGPTNLSEIVAVFVNWACSSGI